MPSPPPQPVPTRTTRSSNPHPVNNLGAPSSVRMGGGSPMSYGAMTGISFANGGGFSFENKPRSVKWGNGGMMGSYGAKFYGDAGGDSPVIPFSTSITMDPSSFAASGHAFGLPNGSMSSSYHRRSYAAAVAGARDSPHTLSNSFASMSFQPMSLGTSYNRSQVRGLMAARSDAELTKAYECCGKTHSGLHALLEHVEDCHPFSDPSMPPDEAGGSGFSPVTNAMDLDLEDVDPEPAAAPAAAAVSAAIVPPSARSSISPALSQAMPVPSYPLPTPGSKSNTPPDASMGNSPLKLSDVLKSPPEGESMVRASNLTLTRTQSTGSSPQDNLATPTASTHPSPSFPQPKINPARPHFLGGGTLGGTGMRPAAQQKRFDRAFNEVVAGRRDEGKETKSEMPTAVAPGVLFASAVSSLGIPTVPPTAGKGSANTTPKEGAPDVKPAAGAPAAPGAASGVAPNGTAAAGGSPSVPPPPTGAGNKAFGDAPMPQPSLFSSHKPWRCPNPGCNKAYKQSNGLKYHQQKGQCDFAIHDAVDLGLTLEEAEERNRPFVCAVGAGCTKRYRQMNGLKYHYLNSGEHGLYGLRMLQNGTHPHPPSIPAPSKPASRPGNSAAPNRPTAGAPYTIPSHANSTANNAGGNPQGRVVGQGGHAPGHAMPRMGTWPAQQRPNGAGPGANGQGGGGVGPQRGHVPQQQKAAPKPPQPQPVTKGRDAVLFSAVGEDPMDIMSRMDS
ncbi:hypothetical protein IAT38_003931 [Cryptococcus sp. DSM 104549]